MTLQNIKFVKMYPKLIGAIMPLSNQINCQITILTVFVCSKQIIFIKTELPSTPNIRLIYLQLRTRFHSHRCFATPPSQRRH
jgi:hypothetical protein